MTWLQGLHASLVSTLQQPPICNQSAESGITFHARLVWYDFSSSASYVTGKRSCAPSDETSVPVPRMWLASVLALHQMRHQFQCHVCDWQAFLRSIRWGISFSATYVTGKSSCSSSDATSVSVPRMPLASVLVLHQIRLQFQCLVYVTSKRSCAPSNETSVPVPRMWLASFVLLVRLASGNVRRGTYCARWPNRNCWQPRPKVFCRQLLAELAIEVYYFTSQKLQ